MTYPEDHAFSEHFEVTNGVKPAHLANSDAEVEINCMSMLISNLPQKIVREMSHNMCMFLTH